MRVRGAFGLVLTLVLTGGVAAGLLLAPGSPPAARPPAPPHALAPAPPSASVFGWRLTGASWAHRAIVFEVETTRSEEAPIIVGQLTEAYQDRFDEVLVYVFEPGATRRRAVERIQWTRAHGYRRLTLGDSRTR